MTVTVLKAVSHVLNEILLDGLQGVSTLRLNLTHLDCVGTGEGKGQGFNGVDVLLLHGLELQDLIQTQRELLQGSPCCCLWVELSGPNRGDHGLGEPTPLTSAGVLDGDDLG